MKHHNDDRMEHQLRVGVVGAKEPLTAKIESNFYRNPRVQNSWGGGLNLPGPLENAFLLKCFGHLAVNPVDAHIREVFTPDATHWINTSFDPADAHALLMELRRHVTPGLVREGDRYTSMIPIHPPIKGVRK